MGAVQYRRAQEADLVALVALLADDVLGATREQAAEGVSESYRSAFAEIDTDPNQFLGSITVYRFPFHSSEFQFDFIWLSL